MLPLPQGPLTTLPVHSGGFPLFCFSAHLYEILGIVYIYRGGI